jgi:hypothetical protein
MIATSVHLHIWQNQVKWLIDVIILKKLKLVCYTCFEYCSYAVLGLVSISWYASFTNKQGAYVRTQKWHDSRYVRLKTRSANLVLILYILLVWLGYAFYRTRGSSWEFWIWFHKEGKEAFGEALIWGQVTSSSHQDETFAKMIKKFM